MSEEQLKERISQLELEIEQAHAQEKVLSGLLEKKLNEIYTHYHISRTIGLLLDQQEMLQQVIATIKRTIPFDRVSVYVQNEQKQNLDLVYSSGLDLIEPMSVGISEGIPGRIVETGEHVHLHDLSVFYGTFDDFIHCPGEKKREGSYIGIALKAHKTTIGAIGMDNPERFGLSVDDMDFMAILSHQIAAGIEKCRLFRKIEELSRVDELTGLYNRRVFEERLSQELVRRNRTHTPLSLMMLDIDHFKQFNDSYGHQAGDRVLRQIGRIIRNQCRAAAMDVCCRYGGEEFSIIMPGLDVHDAVQAAERLRKAVESSGFTLEEESPTGRVTISIGVAGAVEGDEFSSEQFVKRADEALYCSKRNGRNQVTVASVLR